MENNDVLQTWEIHNRINLYFLKAIELSQLKDTSAAKGRNVGEQIAHIHNVRLMWLKSAAPELLDNLENISKDDALDKNLLTRGLTDSGKAIKQLIQQSLASGGKIKGFKPHVTAFLGYLISHESHHRAQIVISLKENGHPLDKKVLYGIWEWGTK